MEEGRGELKAFPRSNKYSLYLLGLVLAIELGWHLSLGDPRGAPLCNASPRAAPATLCDRPRHRAAPGSLRAQPCRRAPLGTCTYSVLRKSPQATAGATKMQQAQVLPSHDVHVDVLHVGNIFHVPPYTYIHTRTCICSSCLPPLLDSRRWHCTGSRRVQWVERQEVVGLRARRSGAEGSWRGSRCCYRTAATKLPSAAWLVLIPNALMINNICAELPNGVL